jgi:hypothetical protein
LAFTWGTAYYAGNGGTTTGGALKFLGYSTWVAGRELDIVEFTISGESVTSYKVVLNDVELPGYLAAMGGGVWKLQFRYTENSEWAGYTACDIATVVAKIVTNLNTYTTTADSYTVVSKATTPNPTDGLTGVSTGTTTLTFAHPCHDGTATPYSGYLFKGVNLVKYSDEVPAGTFTLSPYTLLASTVYTWRIDTHAGAGLTGDTWTFTTGGVLSKPTTPTPANNSGPGINFSGFQLSWVNGGGATAYKIYVGPSGSLVQVGSQQAGTSYTTSLSELQSIFAATPINQKVYWRVDATNGSTWVTGDTWNFDPRPGKATSPTPSNAATGQRLFPTYLWTAGAQRTTDTIVVTVTGIDPVSGVALIAPATYTCNASIFAFLNCGKSGK